MAKQITDRGSSIPTTTEDEIRCLPQEKMLRDAKAVLEQYAAAFERLASSD